MINVSATRLLLLVRRTAVATCLVASLAVLALWTRGRNLRDKFSFGTSGQRRTVVSSGHGKVFLHWFAWDGDPKTKLGWFWESFEFDSPLLDWEMTRGGFYYSGGQLMQLSVPFWFLTLSFVSSAGILCVRRFTMRGLLVLTTIATIAAACVSEQIRI